MESSFLQSERLKLRPLNLNTDPAIIHSWVNDNEVTRFMFTGTKPTTLEQLQAQLQADLDSGKNVIFMAEDKASSKAIAIVGLYEIHPTARKAEFRILIGEKEFWGQGLGTELTEMLTYYGFNRLNLHRVYLGYTSGNPAAGRAYEKAGYQNEGTLKEDIYRNGEYYDSIRMGMLRDHYMQNLHQEHSKKFS